MNSVLLHIIVTTVSFSLIPVGLILFLIALQKADYRVRTISLNILIIGSLAISMNSTIGEKLESDYSKHKTKIEVLEQSILDEHKANGVIVFFLSSSLIGVCILGILSRTSHLGLSIFIFFLSSSVIYYYIQSLMSGIMLGHPNLFTK